MSDRTLEVECRIHGKSYATFVCQHLAKGEGRGFFCADDPQDPHPDAWCAACESVRKQEGEWNDRSEAFAKIAVLCAGCYELVKQRNEAAVGHEDTGGFVCGTCGQYHPELPMDFGADTDQETIVHP
jgi:hypothetical protein